MSIVPEVVVDIVRILEQMPRSLCPSPLSIIVTVLLARSLIKFLGFFVFPFFLYEMTDSASTCLSYCNMLNLPSKHLHSG